jgi:hypothetical protein
MYIWNELSLPIGKKEGYDKMVGAAGEELSVYRIVIKLNYMYH